MVPLPVAVIVRDVVNSPGLVGIKTGIVDHSEEPAALSGPEDLDAAAKWNVELVVTLPRYLVAGHRGGHTSGDAKIVVRDADGDQQPHVAHAHTIARDADGC